MSANSRNQLGLFFVLSISLLLLAGCTLFSLFGTTETPTSTPEIAAFELRPYDDHAELITISAGTFNMGSNAPGAETDESPEHAVSVGGFQIYSHEVTNGMYAACVQNRRCTPPGLAGTALMRQFTDPAYKNYPVIGVDWNMATEYCEFVGGRLPTEAEWEFAASSGIDNTYPWGNEMPTCDFLNMKGCLNPGRTAAGGSYPDGKTASGIYDMSGNTWEWVFDWYAADYYSSSPTSNPAGPANGEQKIVRGGGFLTKPERVETIIRQAANPIKGFNDVGFRCVKNAEVLPGGIVPPPGGHSPDTPDDGVEGDDPDTPTEGLVSLDSVGFDCVNPDTFSMSLSFKLHFGTDVSPLGVHATISSGFGDGPRVECMSWHLDEGNYGFVCPLDLPSGMDLADLPAWVTAEVEVKHGDPVVYTDFSIPMELSACGSVPGGEVNASGDATCPDAAGLFNIELDQSIVPAPDIEFIMYGGLEINDYCTEVLAPHVTCTGVPWIAGADSIFLNYGSSSDPMHIMYIHEVPLTHPDCSGTSGSLDATARISCPGSDGTVMVSFEHTTTLELTSMSYSWNGLLLDPYCTDPLAESVMCSNVPDPGGENITLTFEYTGGSFPHTWDITATREDCAALRFEFRGSAVCEPTGGYAIVVTMTPPTAEPWKIVGMNVSLTGSVLMAADTLKAMFDTLPPGGADIQYQVCYADPVTDEEICIDFTTPAPSDCPGTATIKFVDLIGHGCDPATNHFFAQFSHSIGVPNMSFLAVSTNISPMGCIDLGGADHGIYCTSDFSASITQVFFDYTDPAYPLSNSWLVSYEPCPTEPPPPECSDFHDGTSCEAHGCHWTGKTPIDPAGVCR